MSKVFKLCVPERTQLSTRDPQRHTVKLNLHQSWATKTCWITLGAKINSALPIFAAKLSLGSIDRPQKMHPNLKLLDIFNILKMLPFISGSIDSLWSITNFYNFKLRKYKQPAKSKKHENKQEKSRNGFHIIFFFFFFFFICNQQSRLKIFTYSIRDCLSQTITNKKTIRITSIKSII